ncbi:MAG: OmpA family protein [Bacteroidota bacterium]
MNKNLINTILFLFLISSSFGQNKRAIQAFEDQRFHDAIAILENEFEEGKSSDENIHIYSMSSFYAGDYVKATQASKDLIEKYPDQDDFKYILIRTQLANGEYNDAKATWNTLSPSSKGQEDFQRLLESIVSQSKWNKVVSKIEATNFSELNTSAGDYSPVMFGSDVVFCTLDKADLINIEELDPSVKDFSKLYRKKLGSNESKNAHEFLPGLIHGKHIGPICVNQDNTEIYYTSASQLKSGTNYNDIFSIKKVDGKWGEPVAFDHNNDNYNVVHPALSENGQTLFFSSDRPGGYGGMDIYMCFKNDSGWSEPINLGEHVNTPENEVFPTYFQKFLYFASSGHVGYGSLDMYRVEESHHWEYVENLKAPFNSPYDDFGICFENEGSGYFSSNRPGGTGKDDIYKFNSKEQKKQVETQFITGKFEQNETAIANTKVFLVDEFGSVIQEAFTNAEGEFFFLKEKGMSNYTIKFAEENKTFENVALLLTDSNGDITEVIEADENGGFSFEILALDDFDNLALMEESDDSFLSITIKGNVYRNEQGDLGKQEEISVINKYGIVIDKTLTDEDGNFIFEQLKPDDQYIFRLSNNDESLKVAIVDDDGNPVKIIFADKDLRYYFERLDADDDYISIITEEDYEIYVRSNEKFKIEDIYYAYNSAELNESAKSELNKLSTIMHNNPHISIGVSSHTDSRATDKYNLKLSQERAEGVAAYLISTGINAKRIDAVGMGEKELVNHCGNDVECSNEEHALNRRTEIRVRKNQNF